METDWKGLGIDRAEKNVVQTPVTLDMSNRYQKGQAEAMGKEFSDSRSTSGIDSTNIGFQLLKKHGWKEGTGLGISEQGRLEPVQVHMKNNKRGLGADKKKKQMPANGPSDGKRKEQLPSKKSKTLSKRMKKMQELEKKLQEKEFERAFFREFWPDNV